MEEYYNQTPKKSNKTLPLLILGILAFTGLVLGVSNQMKLQSSDWACLALNCDRVFTEDEWIKSNCYLEDNEMMCEVNYDEQNFKIPLSGINITDVLNRGMGTCCEYKCTAWVLISYDRDNIKTKLQEVFNK